MVLAATCADSICSCGEIRLTDVRAYGFIAGKLCTGGRDGLIFPKVAGCGAGVAGCCAGALWVGILPVGKSEGTGVGLMACGKIRLLRCAGAGPEVLGNPGAGRGLGQMEMLCKNRIFVTFLQ